MAEPKIPLRKRLKLRLLLLIAGNEPYVLNTAITIKPKSAKFTQFTKSTKNLIEYHIPKGRLYLDGVNIIARHTKARIIRLKDAQKITYKLPKSPSQENKTNE